MTQLLEGKKTAGAIRAETAETVHRLRAAGTVPSLALVLATADESAAWYTRSIVRAAASEGGLDARVPPIPPTSEASRASGYPAIRSETSRWVHAVIHSRFRTRFPS